MRKNMYVMSMVGILSCINASLYAAHAGHGVVVNHKLQRRWSESDIGKAAAPNNNRVLNANLVALQARPHQFSQKNNNVNKRLEALEGEIFGDNSNMVEMANRIIGLEKKQRSLDERIAALERNNRNPYSGNMFRLSDGRTLIFR